MSSYDSMTAHAHPVLPTSNAVRNGYTSVMVNGFVLAVMIIGKIFLTGDDK